MGVFGPKQQDKRARIRRYFARDRSAPPAVFAAAGLFCLIALVLFSLFGLPGWANIVAAITAVLLFAIAFVSFNERADRADDTDIDIWRDEDIEAAVAEVSADAALNSADLIAPDDPIVIVGLPRFQHLKVRHSHDDGNGPETWRFKVKVGEDGVTRFTPPSLTVLHFTKDHLIAYQCDLDLFSGKPLNESIEEYFWQDIVSLQIEKFSVAAEDGERALYRQWSRDMPEAHAEKYQPLFEDDPAVLPTGKRTLLRLKTNAGGGMEIVVADERFVENAHEDSLQVRNEHAIARLRKLLRERKARR